MQHLWIRDQLFCSLFEHQAFDTTQTEITSNVLCQEHYLQRKVVHILLPVQPRTAIFGRQLVADD